MKRSAAFVFAVLGLVCLSAPCAWAATADEGAVADAPDGPAAAPQPPSADEVGQLRHQLASHIDQCNALASSTRRTIESSDAQIAAQRRRYADLSERYNRLRADNAELSTRLNDANRALEYNYQQSQQLKAGQDNAVSALSAASESRTQLQARFDALQAQMASLGEQNAKQSAELNSLRQRNEDLRAENAALDARVSVVAEINAKQAASLAVAAAQPVAIGDRLRLPAATLFTTEAEGKPSSRMLPEGTVVTVMGMPRGSAGLYAVALENGPTGWVSFR